MLLIRDAKAEDREIYVEMSKEFYGSPACIHSVPEEHFTATLEESIRSRDYCRLLMLEDDGTVVGYALLSFTWSNEAGGMIVLFEELYFNEHARGKGFGSKVFEWVEENYPEAKRTRLEVTYNNRRAIQLYERLGYKELHYYQMIKELI